MDIDKYCLNMAVQCGKQSTAIKLKVGAIIAKDNHIISDGYNGTPKGFDNTCEYCNVGTEYCTKPKLTLCQKCEHFKTKPEVLHAESNAIMKCVKDGISTEGATLYITHSPCIECAKLIIQAGIKRVVYLSKYRKNDGILLLNKANIKIEQYGI